MYLIYSTLYYVITFLNPAASYVLISANIDDFKSIANRFIPEEVAGVADKIFERARDALIEDYRGDSAVFRHKKSYNTYKGGIIKSVKSDDPKDTIIRPLSAIINDLKKYYSKNLTRELKSHRNLTRIKKYHNNTNEPPVHFEIDLDEFVENVKKKLHTELIKLAPFDNSKEFKKTKHEFKNNKTDEANSVRVLIKHDNRNQKHSRYNVTQNSMNRGKTHDQKSNISEKKYKRERPEDKRNQAEAFLVKPQKHKVDHYKSDVVTPKKPNSTPDGIATKNNKPTIHSQKSKYLESFPKHTQQQQQNKKHINIARERGSTDDKNKQPYRLNSKYLEPATENPENEATTVSDVFVGYDLVHTNDTYEEYGAHKKDSDYKEPSKKTTKTKYGNRKVKSFSQKRHHPVSDSKILDVFSDVDKITIKADDGVDYEGNNQDSDKKNVYESIISPYAEQLEAEINNMNDKPTTEKNIELSEIVMIESNDNIPTKNPSLGHNKHLNNNKNSKIFSKKVGKNKKPKIKATLIPKRDFYKISSPNYLIKMPIIGEKYHFDEPIPEEDRDPENLKYIGNPPASINGKVVFSA